MNKFLQFSLIFVISAGAFLFASCGSAKNEKPAIAEKPAVVIENSDQPLKVTVSKNGFEPKSIGVKKGQSVKLAFQRTDEENCGEEVVFPKLNIRKKLPLGETVLVEFTASEAGEIGFTCGMDMLRGKILVQ